MVYLLVTNPCSFLSSENIFISPSFLKDTFTRYRIWSSQFFSFGAWKSFPLPSGLHSFRYHFNWCSSIGNLVFLLVSFQETFSLSLVSRSLNMMCLCVDIFGFILLEYYSVSDVCRFVSCQIWEVFSHYFFLYFSAPFFSSSLFITLMIGNLNPLPLSHKSLRFGLFFFSVYFSLWFSD